MKVSILLDLAIAEGKADIESLTRLLKGLEEFEVLHQPYDITQLKLF